MPAAYDGPATLLWRLNAHGGITVDATVNVEATADGWVATATVASDEAPVLRETFGDRQPWELDFPDGSSFDVNLRHVAGATFEVLELI